MGKVDTSVLIGDTRTTTPYRYPSPFPGREYEFFIRPLNNIEEDSIDGVARPLVQRFILGDWLADDGTRMQERDTLKDLQGEVVTISEIEPLRWASRIQLMQNPPSAGDVYSALEILRIMAFDDDTWQLMLRDFIPHVNGKGWKKKDQAEALRLQQKTSSTPASNQDSDTPPLSSPDSSGLNSSDTQSPELPEN